MIIIYIIINVINGKVYIGSTNNINRRFTEHKYRLNQSIHPNEHLQNAWNKYGSDSFEFKTLAVCPNDERNDCEQMFMDLYNSQNHECGYNVRDADAHSVSEETRLKMSESHKGKKMKNYARIIKAGFHKNKQRYTIRFKYKDLKRSFNIFKLINWFLKEYPDEDLEISMEVLDNALFS